MLLTVHEFKQRVRTGLYDLASDLAQQTGRGGRDERDSWFNSLPPLADLLEGPQLAPAHLFFSGQGHSSLEYRIPGSASYADVILLGALDDRPSIVILELKHWATRDDVPGPVEGLMDRHDGLYAHPSDQVGGYVEFVRRSHSAVDAGTNVVGAALFTGSDSVEAYRLPPNRALTTAFPCFSIGRRDADVAKARMFLSKNMKAANRSFAQRFEKGEFRQSSHSILNAARTILKPDVGGLVLLDHQRFALARCVALLENALGDGGIHKKVTMVVKGPPGSGKSVVALKLWAHAVERLGRVKGSKHFVSTSESQADNWEHTVDKIHGSADWLARRASSFQPIRGNAYADLLARHQIRSAGRKQWRETLRKLKDLGVQLDAERRDDACALTVI